MGKTSDSLTFVLNILVFPPQMILDSIKVIKSNKNNQKIGKKIARGQ
jgi:hypothetical protein